jgi:hypothetical protein
MVAHHAVSDELAVVGLDKMIEELDEFIPLRGIIREGVVVGFGASDFAEDVVEGVSGFDFGAAISGHGGEEEVVGDGIIGRSKSFQDLLRPFVKSRIMRYEGFDGDVY